MNLEGEIVFRIPGPPVLDFICHVGYYSERIVQRYLKELLDAIRYLGEFGIAHTDIKVNHFEVSKFQSLNFN